MFYSQLILARKGPLGTIWIAAHLDKKLRKNQIQETNISASVNSILDPEVPIALRLSGHLLLGVVRIFERKSRYLYSDADDLKTKITTAFQVGAVNLPPNATTAPFNQITNPENFDLHDFDFFEAAPGPSFFPAPRESLDSHTTSRDAITLAEPQRDVAGSQIHDDEVFAATMDFVEEPEILRSAPQQTPTQETPRAVPEPTPDPFATGLDDFPPMEEEPLQGEPEGPALSDLIFTPAATPLSRDDITMEETPLKPDEEGETFAPPPEAGGQVPLEEEEEAKEEPEEEREGRPSLRVELPSMLYEDGDGVPTPPGAPTPTDAGPFKVPHPVKRRKVQIDEYTTIPSHAMRAALSSTEDLKRPRRKAVHTAQQVRIQAWLATPGPSLLAFKAPATQGLAEPVAELLERMLIPGKAQFGKAKEKTPPVENEPLGDESAIPQEELATPAGVSPPPSKEPSPAPEPPATGGDTPGVATPGTEVVQEELQENGEKGPDGGVELDHRGVELAEMPPIEMADGGYENGVEEQVPAANGGPHETEGEGLNFLDGERVFGGGSETGAGGQDPEADSAATDSATGPPEGGWSQRTRAVAGFLKRTFEEQGRGGTPGRSKSTPGGSLGVDAVLAGKSRREAARLYFELLVLKTRDYVHVKQPEAYADIMVFPKPKLMVAAL